MPETKITTNASDYEPLRYNGENLHACAPLLSNALNEIQDAPHFAASGRLTLAAPSQRPRGLIDWYWRPSTQEVASDELWQHYQTLLAAITTEIEKDPTRDDYAALLLALNAVSPSSLHAGTAGPVIAPWGVRSASGKLQHGDLRYNGNRPPPPPTPAATPAPRPSEPPPSTPQPIPEAPTTSDVLIVPKRPIGPWQEWLWLLLGLVALFLFLWFLPRLAPWFAALSFFCRLPHINWPLWILLLLGLLLLVLSLLSPIKTYLAKRTDIRRARTIGATGGLLQVILTWNDRNDLDLHIICPDHGRIYYGAPEHRDGARLEHDANAAHGIITNHPVESVVWYNNATPGLYGIMVDPFAMRASKSSAFRITVLHKGRVIMRARGRVYANQNPGPEFQFVI